MHAYWEKRSSRTTVYLADEVLHLLKTMDQDLALKYNKLYISVSKDNKPFNFVIFRPKKNSLGVEPKLKKAEEIEILLYSAGLNVLEYDTRNQRYRIRFSKASAFVEGDIKSGISGFYRPNFNRMSYHSHTIDKKPHIFP